MHLYFHPLSTYSQKTVIAFHEKATRFTPEVVQTMDPVALAAYKKIYPLGKIPLLVDADRTIPESSIIIEYLDQRVPDGPRLIPADAEVGRHVRFHDRMFDLYLNDPCTTIIFDAVKPEAHRDTAAVAKARETIDTIYAYLDDHLAKNTFAVGDTFSMADCAAAAPLGYLRHLHPFAARPRVLAYWSRLSERPSVVRVLEDAKPYLAKMAG